jgi:IclR family pca regulon transcriptional regulator
MEKTEKSPSWFSESLARGLLVIRAFDAEAPLLRPIDVARRSGLNRAAARRYMLTLQSLGYLGADGDRFFLQPKVLDLGFAFISSMQIDRLVQPFLNDLATRTGESSSFAVLENEEVLFVARASSERILQIVVGVGGRVPAYATSLGHALLSGLSDAQLDRYLKKHVKQDRSGDRTRDIKASVERVRKQGWALVANLLTDGIAAIAAPTRARNGDVNGAINVASYGAVNARAMREHVPLLLETASNLGRALQSVARGSPTGENRRNGRRIGR